MLVNDCCPQSANRSMANQFELRDDGIMYHDQEASPKRSQQCYDAFSLGHIPFVSVSINVTSTTEKLSVFIPKRVISELPTLKDFTSSSAKATKTTASTRSSKSSSAAPSAEAPASGRVAVQPPQLPGSVWGLLAVLKLLLQKKVDMDALMLAHAYPPVGAEALAVRLCALFDSFSNHGSSAICLCHHARCSCHRTAMLYTASPPQR